MQAGGWIGSPATTAAQPARSRILLVEGNDDHVSSIRRELARAGIECVTRQVDTKGELRAAVRSFEPDVILADDARLSLTVQQALAVIRDERPDTPVLILTESLVGETAAEFVRAGTTDCVGKH
jgi:CheY-like chemotaxis protein